MRNISFVSYRSGKFITVIHNSNSRLRLLAAGRSAVEFDLRDISASHPVSIFSSHFQFCACRFAIPTKIHACRFALVFSQTFFILPLRKLDRASGRWRSPARCLDRKAAFLCDGSLIRLGSWLIPYRQLLGAKCGLDDFLYLRANNRDSLGAINRE
jgi:hypothetical protein